jgi:phosphotransferase system IIA component
MNEKWVHAIHVLSNEIWENDTLLENSQITQHQIGLKMSHMIDILWFIMMQSVNLCRTRADNTQYTYDDKQKVSFTLFPSMFSYYWIVGQYILINVWCKSSYKSTVFAPVGKNTANMLKSRKFTRKIQKGGHWEQIWHVLKCKLNIIRNHGMLSLVIFFIYQNSFLYARNVSAIKSVWLYIGGGGGLFNTINLNFNIFFYSL